VVHPRGSPVVTMSRFPIMCCSRIPQTITGPRMVLCGAIEVECMFRSRSCPGRS
jgi:hypothetical protein